MSSAQAERLHLQSFVYQEDQIQTMAAAKAKLVLVDDTVLTLGPESSLRLTEYVYTPHSQHQKSVLQVFVGAIRVALQTVLPDGIFEVHTSALWQPSEVRTGWRKSSPTLPQWWCLRGRSLSDTHGQTLAGQSS